MYNDTMLEEVKVVGAKEHNLKNVSVTFPRNKLVVITGLSGSGKSSLAFDTIYSEAQRRYMESLSAYARQFLDKLDKPDVDYIEGLSPAISIDQKSGSKNPRSTVGTVTEIYDYFRLLFSSIGIPHCPNGHGPIQSKSIQEICQDLMAWPTETVITIYAPLISNRKGEFHDLLKDLLKEGFTRVEINGDIQRLDSDINLDKKKKHSIRLVVDRLTLNKDNESRLFQSIESAITRAKGLVTVFKEDSKTEHLFSESLSCPHCHFVLPELSARLFSFNSPIGACGTCNGLGEYKDFDPSLVISDPEKPLRLSINRFINLQSVSIQKTLAPLFETYQFNLDSSYAKLTDIQKKVLFYGSEDVDLNTYSSQNTVIDNPSWQGIIPLLRRLFAQTYKESKRFYFRSLMSEKHCLVCNGARLNKGALHVTVHGYSVQQLIDMPLHKLLESILAIPFSSKEIEIISQVKKEIINRLNFLNNVGLSYLSLSRQSATLSGGEFQRIRLATQIGSALTGVLYVLDEPSIGLHQKDNEKLIETLKSLRDLGNSLLVVEHDEATILASDYVIEIGPGAGSHGGNLEFSGSLSDFKQSNTLTAQYLTGKKKIDVPTQRRNPKNKGELIITGVREHNLKNIDITLPLGKLICITGVSGSGKSTLLYDVLHKAMMQHFYNSTEAPGIYNSLKGLEHLDKVITIDQTPIGRTPRSNPATYIGLFTPIRDLFTQTKEARIRGYKAGRFSFNVKGGRCEACEGDGLIKIEMHFLSDVYVTCDVCNGKRYNQETLEVKYKNYSISDVLDMTVHNACEIFKHIPAIYNKLKTLEEVGLGYVHIGQAATTLSGGEAQRIKLAKELSKRSTGKTCYLLDEPTTGLHFEDIKCLLEVLNKLVDQGNTVIIIEHNLDVIKTADHLIDIGPDGGDKGGSVVANGTPEEIIKVKASYTGRYLKPLLKP